MVVNLESLNVVFYKVQLDLHITAHNEDLAAFTEWAMEAIEYIGGLNRIPGNNCVTSTLQGTDDPKMDLAEIKAHIMLFKQSVVSVNMVKYYKATFTKIDDYEIALPYNGQFLDDTDKQVYFDYIQNIDGGQVSVGLRFNRVDGYAACSGMKLPQFYKQTGEDAGIYIPAIASYKDAIYWYITMKLLWQEVFRGKNKEHQLTYASGMWNNLKNRAYADLMMPDNYELFRLAQELGLGVSYTGLNKRTSKQGIPMDLPMLIEGTDKTAPTPLIPNVHPPTPPWPRP
jgi:hypothetical protein